MGPSKSCRGSPHKVIGLFQNVESLSHVTVKTVEKYALVVPCQEGKTSIADVGDHAQQKCRPVLTWESWRITVLSQEFFPEKHKARNPDTFRWKKKRHDDSYRSWSQINIINIPNSLVWGPYESVAAWGSKPPGTGAPLGPLGQPGTIRWCRGPELRWAGLHWWHVGISICDFCPGWVRMLGTPLVNPWLIYG